mmetsp:Transcript_46376/g.91277  ORF Transcript_46376/g.91277 Transcript_46376/m.91277 type:complete len:477 (+) Transcript_46376:33-1463(+)|eukprot:CAMPEP_0175180664 /NCGR_PEP_ID=MMETSP0087-20121206/36202_1 /TAXON_ID=136419 /ORGANISM="Unknown Unknown, Strain D1" /LENGTH=476 /DNA_ID=CAMNT_0016473047 /DNA_START=14 /DNA_END=1444 /DNA_ORIENTATION=+
MPTYSAMVSDAVLNIRSFSKGASRQAIAKYVKDKFDCESTSALRVALKKLVEQGVLKQDGARFKLEKQQRAALRAPKQTRKKKKASPKKKKATKKTTAKKSTKKSVSAKKSTKKAVAKKASTKKSTAKKAATKKTKVAPISGRAKRAGAGLKRQNTVHVYEGHPETEPTEAEKAAAVPKKRKKPTKKASTKKATAKKAASKKSAKKKSTAKKAPKKATNKGSKKTAKKSSTKKKAAPKRKAASAKQPAAKRSKAAVAEAKESPPSLARQASSFTPIGAIDGELHVAADGTVYEANLAQIDLSVNMDKFYKIQVLEANDGSYYCCQAWGRTGTAGQTSVSQCDSAEAAIGIFEKKFKDKAGAKFEDRETYIPKPGKYRFKKKDYNYVQKGTVMWQYYVDDHVDGKRTDWYDYFPEASANVESVYQEWKNNRAWLNVRCVQSGHWSYQVDFNSYSQTNNSTKKKRTIRRTVDGKKDQI